MGDRPTRTQLLMPGSAISSSMGNLPAGLFLVLLSAVLVFTTFRQGGVHRPDWSLTLLALGLTGLLYAARSRRQDRAPRLTGPLSWAATLFVAVVALQVLPLPLPVVRLLSPERAAALAALAPVAPVPRAASLSVVPAATLAYLFGLLGCAIVFFLVREIAWRFPDRPWLLVAPLLALAALQAAIGVGQEASGRLPHAFGSFVNRNNFAGFLEMVLPFAVLYPAAVLRRGARHAGPSVRSVLAAGGALGLAGLLFTGIVYSLSRMGFTATVASLLLMGALAAGGRLSRTGRALGAAALVALCLACFLYLPPDRLVGRFAQLSSGEYLSAEGRLPLWSETLGLIAAYPVFGCGLGGYESAFLRYKASEYLVSDDYAHNEYLQLLAETGVTGFLAAAILAGCLLARALRAARRPHPDARSLGLACAGSLLALLVHGLADSQVYIPANALLLAWVAGVTTALEFLPPAPGDPRSRLLPQFLEVRRPELSSPVRHW